MELENETILTDVSEAETDATAQVDVPESSMSSDPVVKREQKMAALAESRKSEKAGERRAAWLRDNPESDEEDYESLLKGESAESLSSETPAGKETPSGASEEGSGERTPQIPAASETATGWQMVNGVRVKTLMVNGQKQQITEEQYDRMLQKELAGDDKLRKAAQIEQELNRRKQFLDEQERKLQAAQPPKPDAGAALKEAIARHTELLLEGDVDAANEQMVQILNLGRDSSTPNIDHIAAQAATRAVSEVERKTAQSAHDRSINEGWQTLLSDYQDVVSDPDNLAFADIQVKRLREENPDWAPAKVIVEAGKYTREKLKLSGTATPGVVTGATTGDLTAERQARKASIRPLPSVSGKPHKPAEKQTVDMSPAAKIQRMRERRAL